MIDGEEYNKDSIYRISYTKTDKDGTKIGKEKHAKILGTSDDSMFLILQFKDAKTGKIPILVIEEIIEISGVRNERRV